MFQTLAVFFLVGGYSAARGYRGGYPSWLRKRMIRLARPAAALLAVWTAITAGMWLAGVSSSTMHTIVFLVISPLWFLLVYAGLTALTPAAVWLVRRFGAWAAAFPAAVVAATDLVRFGLHGPGWVGWVNVAADYSRYLPRRSSGRGGPAYAARPTRFGLRGPSWVGWVNLPAGWLVPYLLGIAWALGRLRGRRIPALMLAGGAAATATLIAWAGYPASMVGVNGSHISNLNPPTLAVVTFGIAQCGLALLLRDPLARLMRRPLAWAGIALVNLSAMTLFLWHQTGRVPGLLTSPAHGLWVAERLAWLPVFAITLSGLWLVFRRAERG